MKLLSLTIISCLVWLVGCYLVSTAAAGMSSDGLYAYIHTWCDLAVWQSQGSVRLPFHIRSQNQTKKIQDIEPASTCRNVWPGTTIAMTTFVHILRNACWGYAAHLAGRIEDREQVVGSKSLAGRRTSRQVTIDCTTGFQTETMLPISPWRFFSAGGCPRDILSERLICRTRPPPDRIYS